MSKKKKTKTTIITVGKTSAEKGSGVSEKYSCDCIRAISRADICQVWYWFFYDYEVVFWPPLIFLIWKVKQDLVQPYKHSVCQSLRLITV